MKKLLTHILLAILAPFAASSASAAIVVKFTPSAQQVQVGETVQIDMSISGLNSEVLSAFDLNFVYDASVLSYAFVDGTSAFNQLGEAWGATPLLMFDNLVNGDLGVQGSSLTDDADLAAHQDNAFLMFHFDLTADADGTTLFTLGADPLFERNFVGLNFATLDLTIESACVAVGTGVCATAVPEPSGWLLSLAALGALGAVGRRAAHTRPQRPNNQSA
jgi:Cohesin domain